MVSEILMRRKTHCKCVTSFKAISLCGEKKKTGIGIECQQSTVLCCLVLWFVLVVQKTVVVKFQIALILCVCVCVGGWVW